MKVELLGAKAAKVRVRHKPTRLGTKIVLAGVGRGGSRAVQVWCERSSIEVGAGPNAGDRRIGKVIQVWREYVTF